MPRGHDETGPAYTVRVPEQPPEWWQRKRKMHKLNVSQARVGNFRWHVDRIARQIRDLERTQNGGG